MPQIPHMLSGSLDATRAGVEERAVPLLEHEEAPDPGSVVPLSRLVQVEHALDGAPAEVATVERPRVEQPLARARTELPLEPCPCRDTEALLGLPEDRGRQVAGRHLP